MDPKLSGAKTNPKVNPKNLEKQKKNTQEAWARARSSSPYIGSDAQHPFGLEHAPKPNTSKCRHAPQAQHT